MVQQKVAIIGTGFGSLVHYPSFVNHPDFYPCILAGRNEEKTKRIASKLEIEDWTTKVDDIFKRSDIDVVSIATQPKSHFTLVKNALNSGKHVICERPLGINASETKTLLDLSEEHGLTAMVNLELRYLPERIYFLELIKNGYLGDIYNYKISIRNDSRINPRAKGYNWWADKKEGGGVLNALGSVYIDLILQIFQEINSIFGKTSIHIEKRLNKKTGKMKTVSADDAFIAFLTSGNTTGSIHISSVLPFTKESRIEFFGKNGYLSILEDFKIRGAQVGIDTAPKKLEIPKHHQMEIKKGEKPFQRLFSKLLDDFSRGIKNGNSPAPNFQDGHNLQLVLDGIIQSSAKNEVLKNPFSIS